MRNLRRQLEQLRRDLEEVQKLHREALEEIRRLNRELADTKNGRGWKIANGINVAISKARSIFKRVDPSTPPKRLVLYRWIGKMLRP